MSRALLGTDEEGFPEESLQSWEESFSTSQCTMNHLAVQLYDQRRGLYLTYRSFSFVKFFTVISVIWLAAIPLPPELPPLRPHCIMCCACNAATADSSPTSEVSSTRATQIGLIDKRTPPTDLAAGGRSTIDALTRSAERREEPGGAPDPSKPSKNKKRGLSGDKKPKTS